MDVTEFSPKKCGESLKKILGVLGHSSEAAKAIMVQQAILGFSSGASLEECLMEIRKAMGSDTGEPVESTAIEKLEKYGNHQTYLGELSPIYRKIIPTARSTL